MASYWPYAAPQPVAAPPASSSGRLVPIGVVALVLAVLEVGWFGYKLAAALLAGVLDHAQRALLPGKVPPALAAAVDHATSAIRRFTGWEVASLVPTALAAVALGIIAVGLLVGRVRWLDAARIWCGFAFTALAITGSILAFVVAPQLLAIERWVQTHLGGTGGRAYVAVPTMVPMVAHAAVLALWPLILWFWAGYERTRAAATHA